MTISPLYIATNGLLGFGAGGGGTAYPTAIVTTTFVDDALAAQFEGSLDATIEDAALTLTIVNSRLLSEAEADAIEARLRADQIDTEFP